MSVQTHHQPSNFLHLKRNEEEMMNPSGFGVLGDSSIFLSNIGGDGNPKKRGREIAMNNIGANQFMIKSQPSIPRPQKITRFNHLQQSHNPPPFVSTGLQLTFDSFGEQNLRQNVNQINPILSSSPSSSLLCGGIAGSIENYNRDVEQLLQAQAEQLRQALFQTQQSHYQQLLLAAEKSATQILENKSNRTEIDRLVRCNIELENQLNRLQAESLAWQSKAIADTATADSIRSQIQQVMARVEDVGSSCNEPDRDKKLLCRSCRNRTVSVVVLPCRHLCLCEDCDAGGVEKVCPVCNCVGSGSVSVFL